MLNEKKIEHFRKVVKAIGADHTVGTMITVAQEVSKLIEKDHRYACGLETGIVEGRWSYKGIEQPNTKASGFFNSPDGQNGEFYYALKQVGCLHHFYMAEYHWGVRLGKIILTYTEGDIDIFEEPVGYKAPKS